MKEPNIPSALTNPLGNGMGFCLMAMDDDPERREQWLALGLKYVDRFLNSKPTWQWMSNDHINLMTAS